MEGFPKEEAISEEEHPIQIRIKTKKLAEIVVSYQNDDINFYQRREPNGYQNESYDKDDRRQDKRMFRGTYFKCGGEGYRDFECKKIENTRITTLVEEDHTRSTNKLEDG